MDRERAEKLIAMNKAFKLLRERQKKNLRQHPEIMEIAKRVRAARERDAVNQQLLTRTVENLRRRGFDVHVLSTPQEVLDKVLEIIGDERIVIKSKSNVTKEIRLREELESRGIEVLETDVGDRLIQILNEKPSHPTGPSAHLSIKTIAERLSEHYGVKIEPDARKIVEFLREDIENGLKKAKIGITEPMR